ncbi:MAG: hypothetical protein AAGA20_07740 [Planctomycetota bacterium]
MAEEFGDAVNVLFVEVQGADDGKVEHFCLDKKWMGTSAMWTTERPFNVEARGIPHFALLGVDGEVILFGNPISLHSKIEELVQEQLDVARKGPEDLPKSLKKSWKSFQGGNYADAIEKAQKVVDKGEEDAEYATGLVADIEKRAAGSVDRASWLMDSGRLVEVEDLLDDLEGRVEGMEDLHARVLAMKETLESDDMKAERDAAKALAKIEETLHKDGLKARNVDRKLEKLVEKYAGTKCAERAKHLLDVVTR